MAFPCLDFLVKKYSLNSVAFLFFFCSVASIVISIIFTNSDETLYRYYTSCHGTSTVNHDFFFILAAIQILIIIFTPEVHKNSGFLFIDETDNVEVKARDAHIIYNIDGVDSQDNFKLHHINKDTFDSDIASSISNTPSTNPNIQIFQRENNVTSIPLDSNLQYNDNKKNSCLRCFNSIAHSCKSLPQISWNSLWMLLYHTIYILGFHASLLGWRIYGNNESNYYTNKTCQHMNTTNFADELPLIRSVISDFTYVEVFISHSLAFLWVRKFDSPFFTKNYFMCRNLRDSKLVGFLLQFFIYATMIFKVTECLLYGYGTPMQIVSGILLANVTLLVLSILTHVLQVDEAILTSVTLEFHWLWSTISLLIIWLCGLIFYLSVYGIGWSNYILLHLSCWIIFISITFWKFKQIFPVIYRPISDSRLDYLNANEENYEFDYQSNEVRLNFRSRYG